MMELVCESNLLMSASNNYSWGEEKVPSTITVMFSDLCTDWAQVGWMWFLLITHILNGRVSLPYHVNMPASGFILT